MSLEEAYRVMRIINNSNKVQNVVKFENGELSTDKEKISNKIKKKKKRKIKRRRLERKLIM